MQKMTPGSGSAPFFNISSPPLMIIGVPKEIKDQEYRVALLPSAAYQLGRRGHQVLVEQGAGDGAGYPDDGYREAGAAIVRRHAEAFLRAELVVKVKEPQPAEVRLLRPGQILFTYLHLAADKTPDRGAGEVRRVTGHRLRNHRGEPPSAVAGTHERNRRAHVRAGRRLFSGEALRRQRHLAGRRAGVLPGQGRGARRRTSGINAARMATGLGADVTILEVDIGADALSGHHFAHRAHALFR